ncbi:MAG: hypothetical protein ACRC7R_00245, partial [Sarcina sp.]
VDKLIAIGSDSFKCDLDNIVIVKAKGYDDVTFTIKKDGTISFDKKEKNIKGEVAPVKNEVPKKETTLNNDSNIVENK